MAEQRRERPLSPFMLGQYYRLQLTSVTSILTRITGNALIVAGLLIIWWLLAAATGPEAFAVADGVVRSWLGNLVLFLSLWAVWYHTLAGIRHLVWDQAVGLDLATAHATGWAIIGGSAVLTILTVILL